MDKHLRLFGKVSIIDIAACAAVILLLTIAVGIAAPRDAAAAPGDTAISYTVELQRKRADFIEKVKIGSEVYDSQRGYHIGRITNVRSETYREDAPDHAGKAIRRTEIEGLHTVYVTVEARAQITEQTTAVGAFDILVGKEIFLRTKDFASSGYVVERLAE